MCARFFRKPQPREPIWRERARRILAAIATPHTRRQGRMLGDYLLALDDAGVYTW